MQALPRVLADPGIDAVIVLFVPPVVASAQDVAERWAVRRPAQRSRCSPPSSAERQ